MTSYGAPQEEYFAAYKWIILSRKRETYIYMTSKIEEKKKVEKDRSFLQKCGSLIKTIMIYGTVAAVVIPMIYSLYTTTIAEKEREERMARDEMDNMKPPSDEDANP